MGHPSPKESKGVDWSPLDSELVNWSPLDSELVNDTLEESFKIHRSQMLRKISSLTLLQTN